MNYLKKSEIKAGGVYYHPFFGKCTVHKRGLFGLEGIARRILEDGGTELTYFTVYDNQLLEMEYKISDSNKTTRVNPTHILLVSSDERDLVKSITEEKSKDMADNRKTK